MANVAHPVVTDLVVGNGPSVCSSSAHVLAACTWHRIDKDLYLNGSGQSAWLFVALANEEEITAQDLLVLDVRVSEQSPEPSADHVWESRPYGIWLLRGRFSGQKDKVVRGVDVLFGVDAVDPRPRWTLIRPSLVLSGHHTAPVPRLSVLRGSSPQGPIDRPTLRVRNDGKFKIVQISDTHMVTGVGICKDAIDAHGRHLPESEADPLTVGFIERTLDIEKPDLVVLTGDQLHHDISDSQSALFKVISPIIERSIPSAAVFGNHDSEGIHALSRTAQMAILQDLPFSLCEPGPEQVAGIGNYYLKLYAPAPSDLSLSTLYFLDSHGQVPSNNSHPDYEPISRSQIDWFVNASRARRNDACQVYGGEKPFHISLVFLHIPLTEYGDQRLEIHSGTRREPTESPCSNSNLYDALVEEGISALSCGHDHVNDFCALLPRLAEQDTKMKPHRGPWLCYGGGSGFGGYCSYGNKRFHRRMRVWELDTHHGKLETWIRVEYATSRMDELVLVENGAILTKKLRTGAAE